VESQEDQPTQLRVEPSQHSIVSEQMGQVTGGLLSHCTQVEPAWQTPLGLVQEMWYAPTSQVSCTVQLDLVWMRWARAGVGRGAPREARKSVFETGAAFPPLAPAVQTQRLRAMKPASLLICYLLE